MPRTADFIGKLLIKLIWYYLLLQHVCRAVRLTFIKHNSHFQDKLLIKLIWYYLLLQHVCRAVRLTFIKHNSHFQDNGRWCLRSERIFMNTI